MAETLTKEQSMAVENRGRSLLVSAAAGSGKTKVLVERLFSYVAQEEANLDDFLIITYTRAAAAELRAKIAKVLAQKLQEDPADMHLRRQMLRLYRADIKTVDAFCTALLRENCHLLLEDANGRTLRPDFRVLDESEAQTLRERVLARVLEEFYDTLDAGGTLLADTLGAGRDDRNLAALVLDVHKKLQAQPYAERWILAQEKFWSNLPDRIEQTPYGAHLLEEMRRKALHWRGVFTDAAAEMGSNAALNDKYAPLFLNVAGQLATFAEACSIGWDEASQLQVVFPRLAVVRNDAGGAMKTRMKNLWDGAKKSLSERCAVLDATSAQTMEDLRAMAPAMLSLLSLTSRFSQTYQAEKRRRNAADFADQEHEAIVLLQQEDGTPTELARSISKRYREIMVDEYQDTNEVQNCIFSAISRGGKNLFTVGDVKQSIYRFRLADPGIFLNHYETYPPMENAAEGESAKILLSRNFRSRKEVLDATNYVFSNLLSREMGEMDYGADEMLRLGASYEEKTDAAAEFHVLDLPAGSEEDEHLRAQDAEAAFVARYIRNMLTGGFTVQDEKTGLLRPVREEDIVILMRSPSARLTAYRRAMEAEGITCAAEGGGSFYETMEIAVLFALLRVIDNPRQDVPLISVLRSPLFSFSANRLAAIRAGCPRGDFYDALCADDGEDSAAFLAALAHLRERSEELGVYELLSEIDERCHIHAVFGAMPRGQERCERLEAFFALAADLDRAGFRHVFDFVRHMEDLLEIGQAPVPQLSHTERGVRIMTIHKSKGLEFPVVILSDLAKPFNNLDFQSSVLVHSKEGLGPICVDTERRIQYSTVAREALERKLRREGKAEELRILYVAMTRAKEKLVMVYTRRNMEKHLSRLSALSACPVLSETVEEQKCHGDWLLLTLLRRAEARVLREVAGAEEENLWLGDDARWTVSFHEAVQSPQRKHGREEELALQREELPIDMEALSYHYPHAAAIDLPAKLTATQLKGRAADEEIAEHASLPPRLRSLKRPQFLSSEHTLDAAERGTAVHTLLEHLPFSTEASEAALEQVLQDLKMRRLLTAEQVEAVDRGLVLRFLRSPLCDRLRKAKHVEREYRFSILRPVCDLIAGAEEKDEVLLQGVVDCFFEENGELVVVDFKTDRITAAEMPERAERYRPQLESYAVALERVVGLPVKEKILCFLYPGREVQL